MNYRKSRFTHLLIAAGLMCSAVAVVFGITALLFDGSGSASARNALQNAGITNVAFEGPAFFACSEDDSFFNSYDFKGKNAQDMRVEGSVCCGLIFKGCTVRY